MKSGLCKYYQPLRLEKPSNFRLGLPIGPDFGATSAAHRAGIAAFNISPLQLPLSPMCVFARGIKHPLDVSVQRGADSWPVTLSASNRGSSSNDQASISTSQAISGAFGRGAVSGCRRQPRHLRVRRQAGCSVPFRRRMVGGQGHLRSHRAGPHPRRRGPSGEVTAVAQRFRARCYAVEFPPE